MPKMRRSIFKLVCVVSLTLLFYPGYAAGHDAGRDPNSAAGKPGHGTTDRTLTIAFAHWPPRKIIAQEIAEGIDARIIRAVGKAAGVGVRFIECPWPRCINLIKKGQADLITSFSKNSERQAYVHYLGPSYITESVSFWVRKDAGISVDSYQDLEGKRIGSIKGSAYFDRFDQDGQLQTTPVERESQLFKMMMEDRIDIFIGFSPGQDAGPVQKSGIPISRPGILHCHVKKIKASRFKREHRQNSQRDDPKRSGSGNH